MKYFKWTTEIFCKYNSQVLQNNFSTSGLSIPYALQGVEI